MRLLVDAHALLWFVWNHPNLSASARTALSDAGNELLLSMGTFWEIAIKVSINGPALGRARGADSGDAGQKQYARAFGRAPRSRSPFAGHFSIRRSTGISY